MTTWPDGWMITDVKKVEQIEIGDRFPVILEKPGGDCQNCGDISGLLYSWIVRGKGSIHHLFSDSTGETRSLPASLESAPCPVCNLRARAEWLESHSGLLGIELEGKRALGLRLSLFDPREGQSASKAAAVELLQELPHPKKWALFFGENGTGKSHLLICLANACRVANVWSHYTTSEKILRTLRETYEGRSSRNTEDVQNYFETASVLIVDEMHRIKWTDWAGEKLFAILENRHTTGLATWFASNKTPSELQEQCDELQAIMSRISSGIVVAMTGEDWRQAVFERWQGKNDAE